MKQPKISIVIGTYNRFNFLKLCIDSVRDELKNEHHEVIIVDSGSSDDTIEWLVKQKDIVSIIQHNRGVWNGKQIEQKPWAYFMNLAFKAASGKYVCMLSDDSLIVPGAILNGVDLFDEMLERGIKLGAVAFYFRDYPVRKGYAVAVNLGNLYVKHGLFLNTALEEVGYCDESFYFYFGDTDLSLKIKEHGYEILDSKLSLVEHYLEAAPETRASNKNKNILADRARLIEKWKGRVYPEEMEENYKRHVGRWKPHPGQPYDELRTIDKLVAASLGKSSLMPKITVVTVVLNDAVGLTKTAESVAEQTYPFLEYIVINGGDDNETKSVIDSYSSRIDICLSEPDEGIYDAMNKGIALSRGDFVLFLNSGDIFHSKNVVTVFSEHLDQGSDVVYGHRYYRSETGLELQKSHPIEYVKKRMPYCHQAAFYRTSVLKQFQFNKTYRYSADYYQLVALYVAGCAFKQVDEVVCEYLSGGLSESGLRPYLEVLKIQFDFFGEEALRDSVYMKGFLKHHKSLLEKYQ